MREVVDDNVCRGRAALSFLNSPGLELEVVQGFNTSRPSLDIGGYRSAMIGFIEAVSSGPRRKVRRLLGSEKYRVSKKTLARWATEQANLLALANLTPAESHSASRSIAHFGGSVAPIANLLVNGEFQDIDMLSKILSSGSKIVLPLSRSRFRKDIWDTIGELLNILGQHMTLPSECIELSDKIGYLVEGRSSGRDHYLRLESSPEENDSTALGCLRRKMEDLGFSISVRVCTDFDFGLYTGPNLTDLELSTGMRIVVPGAEVFATSVNMPIACVTKTPKRDT